MTLYTSSAYWALSAQRTAELALFLDKRTILLLTISTVTFAILPPGQIHFGHLCYGSKIQLLEPFLQWMSFRTVIWVQQVKQFVYNFCGSALVPRLAQESFSPWICGFSFCLLAGLNYIQNWQVDPVQFSHELLFIECLLCTNNHAKCCGEY